MKHRHCERSAAIQGPWIATSLTLLSMNRCGRTTKNHHCGRSAAVYDPLSPWIAASLTLLSMNRCVIANEVKQSMTSDCMDCRAALAVTGTLFIVRVRHRPDTAGSQ